MNLLGYGTVLMVMLAFMLPVILIHADAAKVMRVVPTAGKPGQLIGVVGNGFKSDCSSVTVFLGVNMIVPNVMSDKLTQFNVPANVEQGSTQRLSIKCDGTEIFITSFAVK